MNTYPDWKDASARERVEIVAAVTTAGLIGCAALVVAIYALSEAVDHAGQYREQHDRCLRQSVNGLEIARCN